MKKRVIAGILMMIMVFASVMGVSAANSKEANVESTTGSYVVLSEDKAFEEKFAKYCNVDYRRNDKRTKKHILCVVILTQKSVYNLTSTVSKKEH